MRRIVDASATSLVPFIQASVEVGSVVHTDGWLGYEPLGNKGYDHEVTFLKGKKETPSELMPRVHRVISLLKRWLMGTHQGAVSLEHLDYYLVEFTFRFNRRKSRSRGSSSFGSSSRPSPLTRSRTNRWSNATQLPNCPTTRCKGYLSQVNTHLAYI